MSRSPDTFRSRWELRGARDERQILAACFLATIAGLAVGLACFWPYLVEEHRRLRPWKWLVLWIGDLTALFWFAQFFASRCLLGRPAVVRADRRRWWAPVASMALALGVDLAYTYQTQREELAEFNRATVVVGQAVAVKSKTFPNATHFRITARFPDRAGRWRTAALWVNEGEKQPIPPALAPQVRAGLVPFPIRVSYDPEWPERSWATDLGPDDGNRLFWFSYCIQFFQGIVLFLFCMFLLAAHRAGECPWWSELHRAVPLMVEAACFAIFGPIEWWVGSVRWGP